MQTPLFGQASGECLRDALKADLATRFVQYAAEAPDAASAAAAAVAGKQGQDFADRGTSSNKMDDESVVVTVEVRNPVAKIVQ